MGNVRFTSRVNDFNNIDLFCRSHLTSVGHVFHLSIRIGYVGFGQLKCHFNGVKQALSMSVGMASALCSDVLLLAVNCVLPFWHNTRLP